MPDDRSWYRKIRSRLSTAILRAVVDRTSDDQLISIIQAKWLGNRVSADVEYKQPQGLFFRPAAGAEGLFLSVAGDTASGVVVDAQSRSDSPGGGGIAEGEGGLYYAGDFKVFLDSSGNVHLGAKSGADYVALSTKIDAFMSWYDALMRGATLPTPGGGAAIQAAYLTFVGSDPPFTTVAATKVKAT